MTQTEPKSNATFTSSKNQTKQCQSILLHLPVQEFNAVVPTQSSQGEKLLACEYVCNDNHKTDQGCFCQHVSFLMDKIDSCVRFYEIKKIINRLMHQMNSPPLSRELP
jgi:hypothetical protein